VTLYRLEEEERVRREAEEERAREAEELRLAEESARAEEERLRRAMEEEQWRKEQEEQRLEAERQQVCSHSILCYYMYCKCKKHSLEKNGYRRCSYKTAKRHCFVRFVIIIIIIAFINPA